MHVRTLSIIASILVLAGCDDAGPIDPRVGTTPDFEVETLQSANLKTDLKQLRGKPVIIDFWATWCGPCRQLSPRIESIYQKYRGKGLEAMAISAERRQDVTKFEANTPHRMPVYIDPNAVANMTLKVDSLPTIVVIGRDGKVTYTDIGFADGMIDQTAAEIDQAVAKAVG
jgi:thiol-disulfide isomerase/thioredoxin